MRANKCSTFVGSLVGGSRDRLHFLLWAEFALNEALAYFFGCRVRLAGEASVEKLRAACALVVTVAACKRVLRVRLIQNIHGFSRV